MDAHAICLLRRAIIAECVEIVLLSPVNYVRFNPNNIAYRSTVKVVYNLSEGIFINDVVDVNGVYDFSRAVPIERFRERRRSLNRS